MGQGIQVYCMIHLIHQSDIVKILPVVPKGTCLDKENFISYILFNRFCKVLWAWKLPDKIFDIQLLLLKNNSKIVWVSPLTISESSKDKCLLHVVVI